MRSIRKWDAPVVTVITRGAFAPDPLYYCFPQGGNMMAKTRLAAEALYKMKKRRPARA